MSMKYISISWCYFTFIQKWLIFFSVQVFPFWLNLFLDILVFAVAIVSGIVFLISLSASKSKWIKELNVRPETIELLEKNVGGLPFDITLISLSGYLSLGKGNKSKNKHKELYQTKNFCTAKEIDKTKRCLPNGKRYLQVTDPIRD